MTSWILINIWWIAYLVAIWQHRTLTTPVVFTQKAHSMLFLNKWITGALGWPLAYPSCIKLHAEGLSSIVQPSRRHHVMKQSPVCSHHVVRAFLHSCDKKQLARCLLIGQAWWEIPMSHYISTWFWRKRQGSWVNPTSAISLFKESLQGWTVGRAPSSPPFDFYSTITLRCLLNFELGTWLSTVILAYIMVPVYYTLWI
jgi:hypothetical protein